MGGKFQWHRIENAFALIVFAVFAMTAAAVPVLGADRCQRLAERDQENYDRRIITSYVAARIRSNDAKESIAVGGFAKAGEKDGIDTLHLYREIRGERYDTRIYYYNGYIYELSTLAELDFDPGAGNEVMEAGGLSFGQFGSVVEMVATDKEGRQNREVVAIRSEAGW